MNASDLFTAYCDVIANGNEHDEYDHVAHSLGLDPDELAPVIARLSATIEADLTMHGSPYWPPETRVDRASGLSVAFRLGVLAALKAAENERVTHGS